MDRITREARTANMKAVRRENTKPEMQVRQVLYRAGYRYRLHVRKLPGSPDIVFAGRRKVIFVHGCFWHGHDCRAGAPPKSNQEFWSNKIAKNRQRDATAIDALKQSGWDSETVWQCELKDANGILQKLVAFLGPPNVRST